MMDSITTTVEICDATGHTTLELTKAETLSQVEANEGSWVFAGNQLVQPEQLAQSDWSTVGTVRVVPGLVGGL